ncbi:MAG: enoyl-CoA hydratase-related protein [Pseudomonadota bacterium]
MTNPEEHTVSVSVDPRGIATVTLDRPHRNNAYNGKMIQDLLDGLPALADDPAVRVVLLRGNGKHFQAGADLAWIQQVRELDEAGNLDVSRKTTQAVHGLTTLGKPTVALVHGGCFGGGTGIISACDIVIADRSAMFSITEARWGLIATPIVPQLLSRIGPGRLRRYSLTCERFSADRAYEIGLVDEVCEAGELDAIAAPILDALLHCPPYALAQSKAAVLEYADLRFDEAELEDMVRPHGLKRMDTEAEEGLRSFLEKRKPSWYPGAG